MTNSLTPITQPPPADDSLTEELSSKIESFMLVEDRDYWRQRAMQAEAMAQALQHDKPLDPNALAPLIAIHINENSSMQAHAYRKALLYVRDITGVVASGTEPSADLPNVMRRLNNNISLTLSRFGDEGLTKTS